MNSMHSDCGTWTSLYKAPSLNSFFFLTPIDGSLDNLSYWSTFRSRHAYWCKALQTWGACDQVWCDIQYVVANSHVGGITLCANCNNFKNWNHLHILHYMHWLSCLNTPRQIQNEKPDAERFLLGSCQYDIELWTLGPNSIGIFLSLSSIHIYKVRSL